MQISTDSPKDSPLYFNNSYEPGPYDVILDIESFSKFENIGNQIFIFMLVENFETYLRFEEKEYRAKIIYKIINDTFNEMRYEGIFIHQNKDSSQWEMMNREDVFSEIENMIDELSRVNCLGNSTEELTKTSEFGTVGQLLIMQRKILKDLINGVD